MKKKGDEVWKVTKKEILGIEVKLEKNKEKELNKKDNNETKNIEIKK